MSQTAFKPVYVLHGDDAFLLDAYRQEIIRTVLGEADPQVCVASFDDEAQLAEVLDELRTLPFLAPSRVVIVRDADAFVSAHREKLEKYLQAPNETSALILHVHSWKSNTRLAKLVQEIGELRVCSLTDQTNLNAWLAKAAGKRGKKISPAAADLLAACVGRDLASLSNELDKLSLYVADRPTIEPADVAALTPATHQVIDFALTNAIAAGDARAALQALDDLFHSGSGAEFKAIGSLAYHLRKVMAVQCRVAAGQPAPAALGAAKLPYALRDLFLKLIQRRPMAKLQDDFRKLIRADLALKSGGDSQAAMQKLVVELCT